MPKHNILHELTLLYVGMSNMVNKTSEWLLQGDDRTRALAHRNFDHSTAMWDHIKLECILF